MIWKDIKGYEHLYMISQSGDVFSKKYNRVIKPWFTNQGYLQIQLASPRKKFQLHRLIAIAFIPNPENKPCINHINCNRADNRIENLEWSTVAENNLTIKRLPKKERRCPHCGELLHSRK